MLVAIEGIDGAGKGTQTRLLLERLDAEGVRVATVSFPRYGQTAASREIADYLNGRLGPLEDVSPKHAARLFAQDRLESRAYVESLIERYDLVIADRYTASNLAYQTARVCEAKKVGFAEWLQHLEHVENALPKPQLTVYLDVSSGVSSEHVGRKGDRSYTEAGHDLHESDTDYLASVRMTYRWLIARGVITPCDSIECLDQTGRMKSVPVIHEMIWNSIWRVFGESKSALDS